MLHRFGGGEGKVCPDFDGRTPVWQLLVVYGHILVPVALAAALPFARRFRALPVTVAAVLGWVVIVLVVIPEIVYVKDFYGIDYSRANTMFKLSFRGQMFAVLCACIVIGLLAQARTPLGLPAALVLSVPLVAVLTYPGWSLEGRFTPERIAAMTLDGLGHLDRRDPADRRLVELIPELPLAPGETVLEAEGQSYSYDSRLSAMTGVPTPLGWFNHEWFWRGDYDRVARRAADVRAIYEGQDDARRCDLLARYRVRYVVIGGVEITRYEALALPALERLGPTLFEDGATRLIQVGPGGLCTTLP